MVQKKSKFIVWFLIVLLQGSCLANNDLGVKVNNIRYIFYTEIVKQGTVNNEKLVQGKELEHWPTFEYDVQPNVFDIMVEVKNTKFLSSKQPKLHIEFWLSVAPEILNNEGALEIEKMKKTEKWVKDWEKDITLSDFKPFESRKIKIGRIRIAELDESESINKKICIMKWKCKVICGESKFEKAFVRGFLD